MYSDQLLMQHGLMCLTKLSQHATVNTRLRVHQHVTRLAENPKLCSVHPPGGGGGGVLEQAAMQPDVTVM